MTEPEWKLEVNAEEYADTETFEQMVTNVGIDPTQGYTIRKQGDVYLVAGGD